MRCLLLEVAEKTEFSETVRLRADWQALSDFSEILTRLGTELATAGDLNFSAKTVSVTAKKVRNLHPKFMEEK